MKYTYRQWKEEYEYILRQYDNVKNNPTDDGFMLREKKHMENTYPKYFSKYKQRKVENDNS
jgi:hypothetical protein